MNKVALAAVAIAAALTAAPASARDFTAFASTTPVLYRFAACVFAGEPVDYDARLEECAPLKATLEAEADAAIQRFHVVERYAVDRELRDGFREIRLDLKRSINLNKPVPSAITDYLACMGERVMASADYQSGDAVDYIPIEQPCYDATIAPAYETASERQDRTIRQLYLRFQRQGRLTWPAARQARRRGNTASRLRFSTVFDRGFLNIGLVGEAERASDAS
ncbi:MAG: hypothetical protein AAF127_05355 [Pseudomonadota bacterium]